jgi:hypothetical protein
MKAIYASEYTNAIIIYASVHTLLSSYTLYNSRHIVWESQKPMSVVPTHKNSKNNPLCSCVVSKVVFVLCLNHKVRPGCVAAYKPTVRVWCCVCIKHYAWICARWQTPHILRFFASCTSKMVTRQVNSSALLYISSFLLLLTNYNKVNYLVEIGQMFCDSSAYHRNCSYLL